MHGLTESQSEAFLRLCKSYSAAEIARKSGISKAHIGRLIALCRRGGGAVQDSTWEKIQPLLASFVEVDPAKPLPVAVPPGASVNDARKILAYLFNEKQAAERYELLAKIEKSVR